MQEQILVLHQHQSGLVTAYELNSVCTVPCHKGLQGIAEEAIDIDKLDGKAHFLLPDSIFLSETEGCTFCTGLLTSTRQAQ